MILIRFFGFPVVGKSNYDAQDVKKKIETTFH